MVFSVPNELLTSCQLPMQMRQAEMEGLLYLELKYATSDCYEINHFSFNSCLCPCGLCHVGTFSLYYLPSNKMLQGTLGVIKMGRGRGTCTCNFILLWFAPSALLGLGLQGYKLSGALSPGEINDNSGV